APGGTHAGPARPADPAVGGRRGGAAGRGAAAPAARGGDAGARGLRGEDRLRPAQPGAVRVRAGTGRGRGAYLRRLDAAPAGEPQLLRPRAWLPLPAFPRQLHRGRHLGDPPQHHRRAGARAARRAARRYQSPLEGPAAVSTTTDSSTRPAGAMPDLRYSDAEEQLRAVVRDLLADRSPLTAVLARADAGEADDVPLWRTL